jgi:hypothetical protein
MLHNFSDYDSSDYASRFSDVQNQTAMVSIQGQSHSGIAVCLSGRSVEIKAVESDIKLAMRHRKMLTFSKQFEKVKYLVATAK